MTTTRPAAPRAGAAVVRDNLSESRRVVWALRPEALEEAALPVAVRRTVQQLAEDSDLRADLVVTARSPPGTRGGDGAA